MRRMIKQLLAILTAIAGVPLLMISGAVDDVVIRSLASTAGICLLVSGGIQFWLLRGRRRRMSGDDLAY